jgi:hypothetical protein
LDVYNSNTGYLSEPVGKYPNLFGNLGFVTDILSTYPYFLPCFVATCISSFCWFLGLFFMKETLNLKNLEEEEEQQPLIYAADQHEQQYDMLCNTTIEPENRIAPIKPPLRDILTPPVLAISVLYAVVAFQMLYFDGNCSCSSR